MKNTLLFIFTFLLPAMPLAAQPTPGRQMRAHVYFRIGDSRIDPTFEGNHIRLSLFISSLNKVLADSNYVVSRISVQGTASPDGGRKRNMELAGARANALAAYILQHTEVNPGQLEIINGGENWTGLRAMIEDSEMPYKKDMLQLMDAYPDDRNALKRKMQYYAESEPWLWMYEHFFPSLRTGAGGVKSSKSISALAQENRHHARELIEQADLPSDAKQSILSTLDGTTDFKQIEKQLSAVMPDETYAALQRQIVSELLSTPSNLSQDNWTLLRTRIASDPAMPEQAGVLSIIDSIPVTHGREQRLRELADGEPYRYIQDHFFPELLIASAAATPEDYGAPERDSTITLSAENWARLRSMIVLSQMPHKDEVLAMIDSTDDADERIMRLREMNEGQTYIYITEVFFPELLYGISPAAQENWHQLTVTLENSDLPNKEAILNIIRTTPPGLEREKAIRDLDGGESWRQMSLMALPELLQNTGSIALDGSGMSFSYELSPAAKAREEEAQRRIRVQQAEERIREAARTQHKPERKSGTKPAAAVTSWRPVFSLKTDLVLWGGVMPGFDMGTWTPNLSAEVYFAHCWSIQLGGAYANWNAFSGSKGLYAVSAADLEGRYWFRREGFRGLYAGVYGAYGQFDVQENASGTTGSYFMAGATAGWAQPLSRHWMIEAAVRLGYRSAQSEYYTIEPGHYWLDRKATEGKFSPQVRLQLVYRFGKSVK